MDEFDVGSLHGRRASRRWERTSVGDLFERVTWSRADHEAIVGAPGAFASESRSRLTYAEADALANRIAHALLARGLERGDRVLLFCENSVEAYVTKFGIAKAGLVATPLNAMLAPDVVAHLVGRVRPRVAIVDAELWPRVAEVLADARIETLVSIEIGGEAPPGTIPFDELIADAATTEPDVEIHADDIWEILFTSGTTSMPKGAMISHQYSYMAGYSFALSLTRGLRAESELRLCSFLPIVYHIGDQAFTVPAFLCGGTLVLGRRPDPAQIGGAIERERITALWGGSPAMLTALADVAAAPTPPDLRSLQVAFFGWGALAPAVYASLKRVCGPEFTAIGILGQTEAVSCHRFWLDEWSELYHRTAPQENYVGIPSPILASRIVDPSGEPLATDSRAPGEVVYRSPAVTAGYYLDEAATREAFRGGWFHSGDSCAYGEQQLRVMLDRYKDIVKTGGENVSSLRVEAVLSLHPAIERAAVVGLPHEHWGEAVTAFVIPRPGAALEADEVVDFCRERLAGFETPKRVVAVDALPETVGGKVLKYKLRVEHAGLYVRHPADA